MPGLMAIISANADPMRRELAAVQAMASRAGVNIQRNLGGGGMHSGSSGIIRESLVLMREISAGNFTKVPGSFSILLQRMGILNLILRDGAQVSRVLADAWQAQSEAASLAAIAAVRKAAASQAAFYADAENTEATLAQAVADEEGAAAAIANAQATQSKAVASAEAAAATATGATTAIGPLGILGGILIGLGIGAYAAYKFTTALVDKLSGLKPIDFHLEYIAKHLKASNQAAEGQKAINKEIQKSIELYNSAAKSAERVATATKEHFEHLRKMNEFEKDPRKKVAREFQIDQQERQAELANKYVEKANLETEGVAKKKQADAIKVSSKAADEGLLKLMDEKAKTAQKFLDEKNEQSLTKDVTKGLFHGANAIAATGVSNKDLKDAEIVNADDAHKVIQAHKNMVNQVAANDELRKKKEELTKTAGDSLSKASVLGLSITDQKKINSQKDANEAVERVAEIMAQTHAVSRNGGNANQQVGAYSSVNSSNIPLQTLTVNQQMAKDISALRQYFEAPKTSTQAGVIY